MPEAPRRSLRGESRELHSDRRLGPRICEHERDQLLGIAIFTDTDDIDQYLCPVITCYGYGSADGRGIFRDHCSEGDAFADGVDHTNPLAKSNLGLSVQET